MANAAATAAEPEDDDRDPQEYGGVFDEDEPVEIVQATAVGKLAQASVRGKSAVSQVEHIDLFHLFLC